MKLKTLFTLYAVVGIIFGVGFLLFPDQLVSSYGESLGDAGTNVARYLGATFIGISVLTWSVRNAPPGEARRGIVLGFFVANAIGLIASVVDALDAEGNELDWLTVAIYLIFFVGFGYFRFGKRTDS